MMWNLNESNFTWLDRLKICKFFLSKDRFWTMSSQVQKFEKEMAEFVGCKHAVFVSSGSTANMLLAYHLKDNISRRSSAKNTVVFPSTTWVTSVSPFIREGFRAKFIDVSLADYSMDLNYLEEYLSKHSEEVACVFVTSLLGFTPDIDRLKNIESVYGVKVMLDNCENTLGEYDLKNVSSFFTSTTSTYFGHQIQSIEGGFIFTNEDLERDMFLMYRNHGMTRSVLDNSQFVNPDVDERFDFYLLGNNARNSDVNALVGSLDLRRAASYAAKREDFFHYFYISVNPSKIRLPRYFSRRVHVPFCLPLVFRDKKDKEVIERYCADNGIETRPIVSGNLLRQTCFKEYGEYSDFRTSEILHNNGFYVGLHNKVKSKNIEKLTTQINNL